QAVRVRQPHPAARLDHAAIRLGDPLAPGRAAAPLSVGVRAARGARRPVPSGGRDRRGDRLRRAVGARGTGGDPAPERRPSGDRPDARKPAVGARWRRGLTCAGAGMPRSVRGMNITVRSTLLTLLCALTPALAQGGTEKPKSEPPAKGQGEKPKDDKDKADKPKADPITDSDAAIMELDKFSKKVDKKGADWKTHLPEPPKQKFTAGRTYFWNLKTNKGGLKVELFTESAPMHVTSVIYLTRLGYYEDIIFHRVIKGFMAQGGDPTGTGRSGAGYLMDTAWDGKHTHDKAGVLSTANTGQPKSEGSQFFLTFGPTQMLDGKYTGYGQVVEGMDTVKALEACGRPRDPAPPTERLVIERAWITVTENKPDVKDETKGEQKKDEKKGEGK